MTENVCEGLPKTLAKPSQTLGCRFTTLRIEGRPSRMVRLPGCEELLVAKAYAVVIGIEKYYNSSIKGVQFARADAAAFRDVLVQKFGVDPSNITMLLDESAHKTEIEGRTKYTIAGLEKEDQFYFFYAGHGMWAHGTNRLTTWDTQPINFDDTTIDVDSVLLKPLRNSACKKSAIFIDACATEIKAAGATRDFLSDLQPAEFEKFVKENSYTAAFFACSAKQKSYSTSVLGHGIWTYHLVRALSGEEQSAIVRDEWVTGESLRDFLRAAVPRYIRDKTNIQGQQHPFALIGASGTFSLVKMESPDGEIKHLKLKPDFKSAYFRRQKAEPFNWLPGFTKSIHTVPDRHSDSANGWAQRLLAERVAEELQTVYENAKTILGLKSRELSKQGDTGAGTVDADMFRFSIETGQSSADPGEAFVLREYHLRVPYADLPENFDDIFPESANEFVLPLIGTNGKFRELVDSLEDVADDIDAKVTDNQTSGTIEVRLDDDTQISIDTKGEIVCVRKFLVEGCNDIIDHIKGAHVKLIVGRAPKLIGSKAP